VGLAEVIDMFDYDGDVGSSCYLLINVSTNKQHSVTINPTVYTRPTIIRHFVHRAYTYSWRLHLLSSESVDFSVVMTGNQTHFFSLSIFTITTAPRRCSAFVMAAPLILK
ncbi:hypothetical protein L9F63_010212, partial [Diploptera punctata]